MRKMLLCLLAAGALGAAAPALASDHDRGGPRGIDVGPLGQCFDRMHPWECRGYGRGRYTYGYSYGFAPRLWHYRHHRYFR
jgi:hypothetical protein